MNWHFRPLEVGETTREPIQGEFFSTEAIRNPTEALVREGIQNSLDAGTESPVKIRLFLASGNDAAPASRVAPWLNGAWPHLHAAGNGLREPPSETSSCPFLVYEDFGACGLQGDVTQAFDEPGVKNHFFYFYRAEGRSGKSEVDRGRWGIGKHVFPRSSRLSTFFGLTIRADDRKRLLMGHTVLKSHRVGSTPFSPDGYHGEQQSNKLVLPISDKATLDQFCADFNLKRADQPGLSLVVPFVDLDFTARHLKEAVVSGYFYPILTGALEVTFHVKPDFVFRQARLALFVDGCFWHGCPKHATKPANNRVFWRRKLAGNKTRDRVVNRALRRAGWRVLRIWEHELARKNEARLLVRIQRALR